MARKIDFSQPLSEADQAYVRDRPWLLTDARLRGEDIIIDDEFTLDGDEDQGDDEGGQDAGSEDTGDGSEGDGDNGDQDSDEDDNEDEDGDEGNADSDEEQSDEDGEGDEDEVAPYDEWGYEELKAEAGNRGLSKSGSKEQLIKRLQEDDDSSPE